MEEHIQEGVGQGLNANFEQERGVEGGWAAEDDFFDEEEILKSPRGH